MVGMLVGKATRLLAQSNAVARVGLQRLAMASGDHVVGHQLGLMHLPPAYHAGIRIPREYRIMPFAHSRVSAAALARALSRAWFWFGKH